MTEQSALRTRRIALGLSQGQLAERAGFKQQHYSQLERGKRSLTTDYIDRLAEALDCHPAELLNVPERLERKSDPSTREINRLLQQMHRDNREVLLVVARSLVTAQPKPRRMPQRKSA